MSSVKIKVQGGQVNITKEATGTSITFGQLKTLFSNVDFSKNRVFIAPDFDREIIGDNFPIDFEVFAINGQIRIGIVQRDMKQGARNRAEVLADVRAIRNKPGFSTFAPSYTSTSTSLLESLVQNWERANGPVNPSCQNGLTDRQVSAVHNMKRIATEVQSLSNQMVAKLSEFESESMCFGGMTDNDFADILASIPRR